MVCEIEKLVLLDTSSKRLKVLFEIVGFNTLIPIILLSKVNKDKRVKDWVLMNTKEGHEIGRVVQKNYKRHLLIEYWQAGKKDMTIALLSTGIRAVILTRQKKRAIETPAWLEKNEETRILYLMQD